MLEKITSIDTNFIVVSGITLTILFIIVSWAVFKYSPVVLKTTIGFALFYSSHFYLILWIGILAMKNLPKRIGKSTK